MAAPRFFLPDAIGQGDVGREFALPDAPAHHALRVLRLAVGDPMTLFTGLGGEFAVSLACVDKRIAWVRIDGFDPVERESPLQVTLVQAIAANDAMDYVVRRSTELGVAAIQPVVSARSARFPEGARGDQRLAHWRQIAVAACEQCGRNRVPHVRAPRPLEQWIGQRAAGVTGLVLAPGAAESLAAVEAASSSIDALVGSEGGFTREEFARTVRAGIMPAHLGPRVLRTETAATALLAAINLLWGDFR